MIDRTDSGPTRCAQARPGGPLPRSPRVPRGDRILIVAPQPFLTDRGTPIATAHVIRALVRSGCEVDVLTYPVGRDPDIAGARIIRTANPFRIAEVPIGLSTRKVLLDISLARALRRLLRGGRYRAVHAIEEAAFLVALLGRGDQVFVYDMHSSLPEQLAGRWIFRLGPVRAALRPCERWVLRRSDRVVCSAGLARYVREQVPGTDVREWRFPGQAAARAAEGESLRERLGIPEGVPVVVYAGSFAAYQGLDSVLAAAGRVVRAVPAVRFVLVGGEEGEVEAVRTAARRLGLETNVIVLERRPREDMPPFMAMADALVLPRAAGSNVPLKLFDYLGAGKPVVMSGVEAESLDLPERVVRTEHTAEAIADALLDVLRGGFAEPRSAPTNRVSASEPSDVDEERRFQDFVADLYEGIVPVEAPVPSKDAAPSARAETPVRRVSVVIPARNEAAHIGELCRRVAAQAASGRSIEVIVVDDGSTDGTADVAREAGARVICARGSGGIRGGNPGAARNLGAEAASGDVIVFLDADCLPAPDWLSMLLAAHDEGHEVVGGSLAMDPGLPPLARCDYYGSWYLAHPGRPAGAVPNHPPANLSVLRSTFLRTRGFTERPPVCDGHEELGWQAEVLRAGGRIHFEPRAVVIHRHESSVGAIVRRSFRWAYSSIEAKSGASAVRMSWLYRFPAPMVVLSIPLALGQLLYILGCWLRAGRLEVLAALPVLVIGRLAYGWGATVGGARWLLARWRTRRLASSLARG